MANKRGIIMCAEADFGTAPHPDPLFNGQLRLIMRENFSQRVSLTLANLTIMHRSVMNELLHSCSRIVPVNAMEGIKYRLDQKEEDVRILRRLLELRCITSELIDDGEVVRYRLTLLGREIALTHPPRRIGPAEAMGIPYGVDPVTGGPYAAIAYVMRSRLHE